MKIIHITAGIQETCGVSQFVVNTARAQQAAGHDVAIITTMTCGYPVSDLKVVLTPNPVPVLEKIVGGSAVNTIVHIHSMWGMYLHHAAVWCRKNHIPYVVSPHGSATPWAMRYKWWKKFPAWWLYQRGDLKGAAGFHVTVKKEEQDVRRLGFAQPVAVAPLGCEVGSRWRGDGELFDCSDCSIDRLKCGEGAHRDVLFLGRIHPVKNVASLIRAWALLRKGAEKGLEVSGQELEKVAHHCPPPPSHSTSLPERLLIAGSNDVGHQEELVELAKSLDLKVVDFSHDLEFGKKQIMGGGEVPVETFQKRLANCAADVVFTGPVYAAAKDWMFAHSWVSVIPSFSENFGGTIIESLAEGTPVIASKNIPWGVLEERQVGWWAEATPEGLAAAVKSALAVTAAERAAMAERAQRFVEECYSWKSSAAKVMELYEEILALRKSIKL